MEALEKAVRDLRLAEQGLMKQAFDEKATRIQELEAEVTYLRRLLNEMLAVPRTPPAPAPAAAAARPRVGAVPLRWKA